MNIHVFKLLRAYIEKTLNEIELTLKLKVNLIIS